MGNDVAGILRATAVNSIDGILEQFSSEKDYFLGFLSQYYRCVSSKVHEGYQSFNEDVREFSEKTALNAKYVLQSMIDDVKERWEIPYTAFGYLLRRAIAQNTKEMNLTGQHIGRMRRFIGIMGNLLGGIGSGEFSLRIEAERYLRRRGYRPVVDEIFVDNHKEPADWDKKPVGNFVIDSFAPRIDIAANYRIRRGLYDMGFFVDTKAPKS